MGWLDGWAYRVPVACNNPAQPANTLEVEIPIPEDWDHFWDTIDSSGIELRLTQADGITVASYEWSPSQPFNKTNKAGMLECNDLVGDATNTTATTLAWLYYGNTGASSGETSITLGTTPVYGIIHSGRPTGFVVRAKPVKQGLTQPEQTLQKTSTESIFVWFELRSYLTPHFRKSGGKFVWEEVRKFVPVVNNSAGSPQAAMIDDEKVRFVEIPRGPMAGFYAGMYVTAGTTANDYTILPTVYTVAPESAAANDLMVAAEYRILSPRAYMTVQDVAVPT